VHLIPVADYAHVMCFSKFYAAVLKTKIVRNHMNERNSEIIIQSLLEKSIEELYLQIGQNLSEISLDLDSSDPKKLVNQAKEWMLIKREDLKSSICRSNLIQEYIASKRKFNKVKIVTAIIDIIAAELSIVPAATIAVLLLKEGLENLCKKDSH